MEDKQNKIIIGVAAGVIILLIALFAIFNSSSPAVKSIEESYRHEGEITLEDLSKQSSCPYTTDKVALAKCLTEKGWHMYGAYWCPHCKAQKEMFGEEAFKFVNYIECTDKVDLCNAKNVKGYPTWTVESTSTDSTSSTGLGTSSSV